MKHLPTLSNYKKLAKTYKMALISAFKGTGKDFKVEIIDHYFPDCTPEQKKRLRRSYDGFLQGTSFKRAYIPPYEFLKKTMDYYTFLTGAKHPPNMPDLEESIQYWHRLTRS